MKALPVVDIVDDMMTLGLNSYMMLIWYGKKIRLLLSRTGQKLAKIAAFSTFWCKNWYSCFLMMMMMKRRAPAASSFRVTHHNFPGTQCSISNVLPSSFVKQFILFTEIENI